MRSTPSAAEPGLVVGIAFDPGHGVPVPGALRAAKEAAPAAVGDVAELGDVNVDPRAWIVVLVTPDRFPGDPVDAAEPV